MIDMKEVAEQALKNYKLASDTYADQQEREYEDLRFQVPEYQWDDDARAARSGGLLPGSGVPVPARPCLSISKIEQPIRLVLNQMQNAHMGVNIHPLNEEANDDTAEILQGLYRTIERDSRAGLARGWAFDRAVRAGRGFYRIGTVYDDADKSPESQFDQKIVIQRILYQDGVKFDPSAVEPDYSDAQWAFLGSWMSLDTFKRKYPKAEVSGMDDFGMGELRQVVPEWVKFDGVKKGVLVAEYWCKHYETETISVAGKTRINEKVTLMWYTLAPGGGGLEVIDSQELDYPHIPIVPVIGQELQPFDTERRWYGMVRPARDAQKTYNFAASSVVEKVALEPKAPFMGVEGTFQGHEAKWNQINTRNFGYVEYRNVSLNGQPAPPPQRMQADTAGLSVGMQLLQQADDFIQSSTSTPDPALGNLNSRDRSGKAIQALQGQAEAAKSNYLSNLAEVSMPYEAKVILSMIPYYYDRPGRVARILDEQDDIKQVMLNAPFRLDQVSGRPIRVNPGQMMPGMAPMPAMTTTGAAPMSGMPPQPTPKSYNLTKGNYGVSVSIGKSWQTRLEQGKDEIGSMIQAEPSIAPIIMPLWLKFQDFPGASEMADLMKKVRDKQYPGLDAKEGEETPEQLKSMLQGMKAESDQLKQQLAMAAEEIKTERTKAETTLQKTQMDNQARIQVAEINAGVKMEIERLSSLVSMVLDKSKAEQAAFERRHAADLDHDGKAHELGMTALGHAAQEAAEERQGMRDVETGGEEDEE